jgi:hypothetical protein
MKPKKMSMNKKAGASMSTHALLCASVIMAMQMASAANGTWGGSASGNWNVSANWSGGNIPSGGGEATISGIGSAITINNDMSDLSLGGLYIPAGSGGSLTISGNPITFTSKSSGNNIASRIQLTMNANVVLGAGSYPHVFAGFCTFNGVISGSEGLKLATDTPTVKLYAANTYTGGTVIPSGNLYVYNLNGLGVNAEGNAAGVTVSAGNANNRLLRFAVANGTFYHPIISTAKTTSAAGTSMVNVHAVENTTLKGRLSGGAFGFSNTSGKKLTVDGEVDCGNYGLYLYPSGNGNVVVNGKVTASVVASSSGIDNSDSRFILSNPENNIAKLSLQTRSFQAGAANVCTGSVWESNQDHATKALWFLNGYDQAINRILTDSHTSHAGLFVYSGESSAATVKAATLTMKATSDANISFCFQQHVSLVWDPQGAYTLTLRDRTHATDGTLEVKRGSLVLTGTTKMANVTGLTVGKDATCSFADTSETPFSADTVALVLDEDATLDIGTKTLTFASVTIGGTPLQYGLFTGMDNPNPGSATKLAQLRGTGVIAVAWTPQPSVTASWIGGAGESLATDANWKGGTAPDFVTGHVLPTFSDSDATGFRAVASSALTLDGLVFEGAGFELAGESGVKLTLGDKGISVNASSEQIDKRTYRVTAPLAIATSQTWNTGDSTNNTLSIENGIHAAGEPDAQIHVGGAGTFRLTGTEDSSFTGNIELKDCLAYVAGGYPFGKAGIVTGHVSLNSSSASASKLFVHLGSCTVDKPMYVNAYSANQNVLIDSNATVYFKDRVVLQSASRWGTASGANVYIDGGFARGAANVSTWQSVWWYVTGDLNVYVRNVPIDFGRFGNTPCNINTAQFITEGNGGTWHFQVASNIVRQLYVRNGLYKCEVDWAFDWDDTILQWRDAIGAGKFDLNGHPARVGTWLSYSPNGEVCNSSATPATFYVNQKMAVSSIDANATTTNKCNLVGNIDFHKRGQNELAFDRAIAATGKVTVAEGRLVLTENASWLGASEVVVAADEDTAQGYAPTLEIASGRTFSKNVELSLGTGSTVAFSGSTSFVQPVQVLRVDGRKVRSGVYTAANPPQGVTFSGSTGAIYVRSVGFFIDIK